MIITDNTVSADGHHRGADKTSCLRQDTPGLYQECRRVAEEVARTAGDVIRAAFERPRRVESKSCAQDLVTETDRAVESLIRDLLRQHFPTHGFIGEESHVMGTGIPDGPTWIVDPIDGTTNFVHGVPVLCISIGLCVGRQPVVGVVYNPISDELFSAALGSGVSLNGRAIRTSGTTDICSALLVTELTTSATAQRVCSHVHALMQHVRGVRMHGSAAMNLCYTACGRVDGYLQRGVKCWDICAGIVIIREAGGCVTDYAGSLADCAGGVPFDLYKDEVVAAASAELNGKMIQVINKCID